VLYLLHHLCQIVPAAFKPLCIASLIPVQRDHALQCDGQVAQQPKPIRLDDSTCASFESAIF
jgi:hypothetical protein